MAKNQWKNLMQGAVVLTLAAFITKLLSAVYRVPFQNLVGDEGFYVYQQIYPIYGIAMTLAMSGLPQFISKLVAEKKQPKEQEALLAETFPLVAWLSLLLWAVTFFFSSPIAKMMGNSQLKPLLQVVSFTFLLVPPLSFYRGNFQGNFLMAPTAISQVVEQFIRVGVILGAAVYFKYSTLSIYGVGMLAMAGAVIGGFFACLVLFHYDRRIYGGRHRYRQLNNPLLLNKSIRQRLLIEGGLLTIYSGLLILFQLVDSFLVVNSLHAAGTSLIESRLAKGVFDRGQPLVQLGLVVATSMTASFLPGLTQAFVEKNKKNFIASAKLYLRFSTAIAFAATGGLAVLLPLINFALFKDRAGLVPLTLFLLSIAIMAVIQAYQSIAQSQNRLKSSLRAAGLGIIIKIGTTGILTRMCGTVGTSISTLVGLMTVLIFLVKQEDSEINHYWRQNHFGIKLLFCTGTMVFVVVAMVTLIKMMLPFEIQRITAFVLSLFGVAVGAITFIVMAIRTQLLTIREWLLIPMGNKILRFKIKNRKEI